MNPRTVARQIALLAALLLALAVATIAHDARAAGTGPHKPTRGARALAARAMADTLDDAHLVEAGELDSLLSGPADARPVLLQVGFPNFYRTAHIAGSRQAGPGSKPEGLRALQQALADLPRDRAVVLYCGCCPWKECPNVRPAYRAARRMGFTDVRVLHLEKNLRQSGLDQGLPEEHGESAR
jgi:hypothetical protein